MSFQFGDGFDCYATITDAVAGYWDGGTGGGATLVTGRFSGSRAVLTPSAATVLFFKNSGSNDAVHHIVVAFSTAQVIGGASLGLGLQLFDGATAQCSIVFRTDGAIVLTSGTTGGATLTTYAGAVTATNTWYAFEFEIVIHNSTGRFRVRKNGNSVDDFDSGATLNTRGGTANNYANRLQVGSASTFFVGAFDDLYWRSDTASVPWVGDIRCITRMPASDAAVQFSRNAGTSNFSCVDEPQQNTTTDYVFNSTPGHEDFYGIAAIASTPLQTHMLTTRAYMQKSDAGARTAAVQLKSGASVVASPTLALTSSGWLWAWRSDTVDPSTSAPWTAVAVNGVTVGPKTIA